VRLHPEHLAIAFIDEIERPEGPSAVERIGHEVQCQIWFKTCRSYQGLTGCVSAGAAWFGRADSLLMAQYTRCRRLWLTALTSPTAGGHRASKAPARSASHQLSAPRSPSIALHARSRSSIPGRPRCLRHPAALRRITRVPHEHLATCRLANRLYSFSPGRTSLIAVFSRLAPAYCAELRVLRLELLHSLSSGRSPTVLRSPVEVGLHADPGAQARNAGQPLPGVGSPFSDTVDNDSPGRGMS